MATANGSEAAQGLRMIAPPLVYAILMLAIPLLTLLSVAGLKKQEQ